MPAFTPNEWLVIALIFLLGVVLGMFLAAGGKWKRRYREEAGLRRDEVKRLEAENARLRKEVAETGTVRHVPTAEEVRRREEGAGPL